MPRLIQASNVTDFTGGLNLRADTFQLAGNESPDLLNVDLDPRGGLLMRRVVAPLHTTALVADAHSLLEFFTVGGARQILAATPSRVYMSTGGEFSTHVISNWSANTHVSGSSFKDRIYLQNGVDAPRRYDGSTVTTMGQAWSEDLAAPTGGNVPIAKFVTTHMGSLWVAGTREGGVSFPNRVRFSHPNMPEDWRVLDYIDIDVGNDGDEITALVPFQDHLLVFKRNSIYAIFGYSVETFQVQPVSREVGAVGPKAVVPTEDGVYFFSWPKGVYLYTGRSMNYLFERLQPAITEGTIPDGYVSGIAMAWHRRRLYVSVPWAGSTTNARTFVLDATLGKRGGWTMYDLAFAAFIEWNPPAADAYLLGSAVGKKRIAILNQAGVVDNYGGGVTSSVLSHYTTPWFDLGAPGLRKRWKRPEVVTRSGYDSTFSVDVFLDYDPTTVEDTFFIHTKADREEPRESTNSSQTPVTSAPAPLIWGTGQWGVNVWGAASVSPTPINGGSYEGAAVYNEVIRGANIGTARAVRLRFRGPEADVPWGVDGVVLKYVPKKMRS